jgi:2-oxoglutarate dehydrogenase E1 component
MTPKGFLRTAESSLDDLASGSFQRILGDTAANPAKVKKILFCFGKLYYELAKAREAAGRDDIAILRIEQFYPLPESHFEAALADFAPGTPAYWVQEEPENMGAWYHLKLRFNDNLINRHPFALVSRPAASSPSTGSAKVHEKTQKELIDRALSV